MAQNKIRLVLLADAVVAALMGALLFQLKNWPVAADINPNLIYVKFSVGYAFLGSKPARAKIWISVITHPKVG